MKRKLGLIIMVILFGLIFVGSGLALARNQRDAVSARMGMSLRGGQMQAGSINPQIAPVMNWKRVTDYSFGLVDNFMPGIAAIEVYSGSLYASGASIMTGTHVFRSEDGENWLPVTKPAFGLPIQPLCDDYWYYIWDMVVFHDQLYAPTGLTCGSSMLYFGGMIMRTDDGISWEPVVTDAFGYTDTQGILILTVFSDTIYAGTADMTTGLQIWRSSTGNTGEWSNVTPSNLANPAQYYATDFQEYHNMLFLTTQVITVSGESQIWFTEDGVTWEDGPMEIYACEPFCWGGNLGVFSDTLYMGVWNGITGGELWSTNNGITWTLSLSTNDPNLVSLDPVGVFNGYMYLAIQDWGTGVGHLWRTADGVTYEDASLPGFDRKSGAATFPNASAIFKDHFFLGKFNWDIGGSIWRDAPLDFWLPVVHR
jgi:hypothetical protein